MSTINPIQDSTQLFRDAYYAQVSNSFTNELLSWSTVLNLSFEIIGGVIFLFVLFYFFSPRIEISEYIAYNDSRGHFNYYFKIKNKHWFFKLVDLKMEIYTAKPLDNGLNKKLEAVRLEKNELPYLDSVFKGGRSKEKSFACQFLTNEKEDIDLKSFLKSENSSHITVVFSCTHILSSIRKKFVYDYHFDSIVDGTFEKGNKLTVKKN